MLQLFRKKLRANDMVKPPNDRRYLRHEVSARVANHPAMLGAEERVLPSYLAKQCASSDGAVVELGCYLGGSTVALLDGFNQARSLDASRDPHIHAYDLFVANDYMVNHTLQSSGIKAGESFEHVYRKALGDWANHVEVHAGDIRNEVWPGEPIKLLYVDILWSWETNQHVFNQFYRAMVPGSWLVHQDFVYSSYPWLPVTMEWLVLNGYFTVEYFAEHSTVAFRCEKQLTSIDKHFDFGKSIGSSEKKALIEKSVRRFRGYPAALLQLSQAVLVFQNKDVTDAFRIVDEVKKHYNHPFVEHHISMVEKYFGKDV
jgi:hypothetical protein